MTSVPQRQSAESLHDLLFAGVTEFRVDAVLLGERIDTRALELAPRLSMSPLTMQVASGCAVVFRYGVVVFFNLGEQEQDEFLSQLRPAIHEAFDRHERETAQVRVDPEHPERVDSNGNVVVYPASLERLQLLAHILAKSVVLAHYEAGIATVFDKIEPLAAALQQKGRGGTRDTDLLRQIGGALWVQHKMVWRVEVEEKPELLWERPDLELLYFRLEHEYELKERHRALERKLELISRTAQTLLDLLQGKRTLRVEWYIVSLILLEIALTLYTTFIRG